jgi:hypothetical protein
MRARGNLLYTAVIASSAPRLFHAVLVHTITAVSGGYEGGGRSLSVVIRAFDRRHKFRGRGFLRLSVGEGLRDAVKKLKLN